MNEVLIVDPSYIDGMINAKMISFSLSKTRALSFTNINEAHDFSLKYGIEPRLILLDEKLSADAAQLRTWIEECEIQCAVHVISSKLTDSETEGCVVVNEKMLIDHVDNWFAN